MGVAGEYSLIEYLALGDSYTIGTGVPAEDSWPAQLVQVLRAEGCSIQDPVVVAVNGWTTGDLLAAIDHADLPGRFDLVSLLIGVNDQFRGLGQEDYQKNFDELLQDALGFAGGEVQRVIVLSIPDWGVTPFAAGRDRPQVAVEIDVFNAINRAASLKAGAHYVDVTPLSRQAANDPAMLAEDGLHPSGMMYAEWVKLVLPAARYPALE